MINKPAIAGFKVTVRDEAGATQLISTTSREIVGMLCTAGGAAAAIAIYDSNDVSKLPLTDRILIAANAGESTPFTPAQLINFKKGIVVVFEQGLNNNAELFILGN